MSTATTLDATHDPALRSWVDSANDPGTDFPIQNLPYGRFRRTGSAEPWRIGVAIGNQVLDLRLAREQCEWSAEIDRLLQALAAGDLNAFMTQSPQARRALRTALSSALCEGAEMRVALARCLVPQAAVEMALPCTIGGYTDFYTSIHHATAVGRQFRPDSPLLPNYRWVPIGYHGRTSSIGVSGQQFARPRGQLKGEAATPSVGPTQRLDYELELGMLIGSGNDLGVPIEIGQAEDAMFGLVLLSDWSARDIQPWEYQPLGPFLSKNFATTISPWVVTMDALAPYRTAFERPAADPQPLPYLDSETNRRAGSIDITLETWLQTAQMRAKGEPAVRLMQSNFRDAYWTLAQLVAHHTVNGCNLQSGDLLGTGTQSGPQEGQGGSLLELSKGGKEPLQLPNGETRSFLADGDTLVLRAFCERAGFARIGLGECAGTVLPARV
jgi:fumarylacetoacetase